MSLTAAIAAERTKLNNIRSMATNVLDTSRMSENDLRLKLGEIIEAGENSGMVIFVESFGFKYGVSVDFDYCFDARFLPNPYYVPELRNHTGKMRKMAKYLEGFRETDEFNYMTSELLSLLFLSMQRRKRKPSYRFRMHGRKAQIRLLR